MIKNIIAYIQGNVRYKFYYSKYFSWLIPNHIHEQIDVRIDSMKKECYIQGSCVECGCMTTQLQMANKACDGNCYPVMVDKSKWKYLSEGNITVIEGKLWQVKHGMFKNLSK